MRGHNLEIKGEIQEIEKEIPLRDVIQKSIHVRGDNQKIKIQEIIHQKLTQRKFKKNQILKLKN